MSFSSVFASFLKYLPSIISGVAAVEQAIGPGNGATKKKLVLNAVTAAASVGEAVPESHIAGISALIDSTVSDLKTSGLLGFSLNPTMPPAPTV